MADNNEDKQALAEAAQRYERARERMVLMNDKLMKVLGKYGRGDTFSSVKSFNEFRDTAGEALDWIREDINLVFKGSLKGGKYY